MGKNITGSRQKNKDKDGETRVLFKKSIPTMYTHSRTCSGASQLYSRSGLLQIKKNLNNHSYYLDKGKLKRDFSVETDFCILRRYYRIKKNKMSCQDSSVKSRHSTVVDTEVGTIEELPDRSACGDNETTDNISILPLDIASLMIDNLKDLINHWIYKHLIENKDTTQKIDTLLDSLLKKLDKKQNLGSSSVSTYVLQKEATNQQVKNKKVATASHTCQYCKHKARNVKDGFSSNICHKDSSSITLPFQYKDIRIISTLSIPRCFHKREKEEKKEEHVHNSWYKMKKIKHKNISLFRSNKLLDSSSFDLMTISTKSLTKKFSNYDMNVKKKKRHIVFIPKPLYKSATDTSSNDNININNVAITKHQLNEMPSLLKSLYANDPVIIANIDKNIQFDTRHDTSTMTENQFPKINVNKSKARNEKCSHERATRDPIVDFIDERIKILNQKKTKCSDISKNDSLKINNNFRKTRNRGKFCKRKRHLTNKILLPNSKTTKIQNIYSKQFTFLYKKANNQMSQAKEFLKHCQNIIQHFEDYDGNKNIKLDVRINVFPMFESRTKEVSTDISNQALGFFNIKTSPTLLYNVQPTEIEPVRMDEEFVKVITKNDNSCLYTPDIIPLLDGAVSQANYIFDVNSIEKVEENSKPNIVVERSTLTSELEIVQEISDLKAVIKDIAAEAKRFVSEQMRRVSDKSNAETTVPSNNLTSSSKCEAVINLRNPSIGIQYSKKNIERQKLLSGLKITKEPKKKETFDYYNRLAKKSTSYRIIESESVLKVTDMTSKANEFNEYRDNEALTCQKLRSLFELTSEQRDKRKLIALYCDGYRNNPHIHTCGERSQPSAPCIGGELSACPSSKSNKWYYGLKNDTINDKKKQSIRSIEPINCACHSSNSQDSCVIPIMPETTDCGYSSTICCPARGGSDEIYDEQLPVNNKRRGMGFGEGCVFCMLLWIPVLVLACLFYGYILRGKVKFAEEKKVSGREGSTIQSIDQRNGSVLFLKLSDLGF